MNVQYKSPTSSGLKVMGKVKVFVHAANTEADAKVYTWAMTYR